MAESYPTFRAGQKVTGALLESVKPVTARKLSDTSRATGTLSADPELQLSVEANAVYQFEALLATTGTTATDDILMTLEGPSGSEATWGGFGPATDTSSESSSAMRSVFSDSISDNKAYGTGDDSANPLNIRIAGTLVTGSSDGAFSISWARFGGTGTITVFTGSYLTARRIA